MKCKIEEENGQREPRAKTTSLSSNSTACPTFDTHRAVQGTPYGSTVSPPLVGVPTQHDGGRRGELSRTTCSSSESERRWVWLGKSVGGDCWTYGRLLPRAGSGQRRWKGKRMLCTESQFGFVYSNAYNDGYTLAPHGMTGTSCVTPHSRALPLASSGLLVLWSCSCWFVRCVLDGNALGHRCLLRRFLAT